MTTRTRTGLPQPGIRLLCALGLLGALVAGLGCAEEKRPRNAVLVLLDTLRADRLSAYGHTTPTTPALDALAEQGVLFETAVSSGAWTLPGMAAIFAGDFPNRRIYDRELRHSLVGRFQEAGFRTAGFVEGGFMSEAYGFAQGFDDFHNTAMASFMEGSHDEVVLTDETFAAADAWLRENADDPFFLVVHTYEPHTPYTRRDYAKDLDPGNLGETFGVKEAGEIRSGKRPFGETERRYVQALYDGGVRTADRALGGLLETLEELGLRDETILVVTSDHGEDLGDRDPQRPGGHGHNLYDDLLRVPLIVHDPTRQFPVSRVRHQVRTIDVLHTILDLLGAPPAESRYGRSLVPLMTGEEKADRAAWSHSASVPYFRFEDRYALRTGRHKLILTRRKGRFDAELYDLEVDPGERKNRAHSDAARTRSMRKLLLGLREAIEQPAPARFTVTPANKATHVEERLKALGYIE